MKYKIKTVFASGYLCQKNTSVLLQTLKATELDDAIVETKLRIANMIIDSYNHNHIITVHLVSDAQELSLYRSDFRFA